MAASGVCRTRVESHADLTYVSSTCYAGHFRTLKPNLFLTRGNRDVHQTPNGVVTLLLRIEYLSTRRRTVELKIPSISLRPFQALIKEEAR